MGQVDRLAGLLEVMSGAKCWEDEMCQQSLNSETEAKKKSC